MSIKKNLAKFIFVGDKETIKTMINDGNYQLNNIEIIQTDDEVSCVIKTNELVHSGKADFLMKGQS